MWAIEGKVIGEEPYVIAEIGLNHNGEEKLAAEMVAAAADAGADAVKFQLFSAEKLVSPPVDTSQFDPIAFFKQFELSSECYRRLFQLCQEKNITFLATPFDFENAEFLENLGVGAYKIASGDLTYLPFIRQLAGYGKPLLVSTGMATINEISQTVSAIQEVGNDKILLFHCTSAYPCPNDEVNLNNLITMKKTFDLPVGLSDHTEGSLAAIGAVALGAVMIEKHFTLDRNLPGPDQKLSTEPAQLAELVADLKIMNSMRGSYQKIPTASEQGTRTAARRSIFAAANISQGTIITENMLICLRPATGISPNNTDRIIGQTAKENIKKGDLITWDMLTS